MTGEESLETLLFTIHHIFTPPKLPQADDQVIANNNFLCEQTYCAAVAYHDYLPTTQKSQWNPILRMLKNFIRSQESRVLSAQITDECISNMRVGDTLALFIRAQNAAIILRKFECKTVFEAFEVSPPAEKVMKGGGKLLCSYPGPAVEVPSETIDDPYFRKELSSFLAQMSEDVLDSAATTRKARSTVLEERDTADPRYITQLLTGILRGLGQAVEVTRIRKRIGDDVLWMDTRHPWRRSSLWLVLRVALQTTLYDTTRRHVDYKAFVMFEMARILRKALQADLPSDLIFCMRAKLSRRLYKLGHQTPDFVFQVVRVVVERAEKVLQARWSHVQKPRAILPPWAPDTLDIIADTQLSLCNSRAYLIEVLQSKCHLSPPHGFEPRESPRFHGEHVFDLNTFGFDSYISLIDFERSVQDHLDDWVEQNRLVEFACVKLAACIENYSNAANELYASNPEDKSLMLLTVFELWVALDKLVLAQCPLLQDYSPEIPLRPLETLLLRRSNSIQRLASIFKYIRHRHRAQKGLSIFTDECKADSFPVRYFQQSDAHRSLKSQIQADATTERSQKLEELHRKNAQYDDLKRQARLLGHQYRIDNRGIERHNKQCQKCSLDKKAGSLQIDVHEWPLSSDSLQAMATVFELRCPIPFSVWRSTTHRIMYDICTPVQERLESSADPSVSLRDYRSLKKYVIDGPGQARRITIASTTKSFLNSHYRSRKIPSDEDSICVNNGLRFRLIDESKNIWASGCFANANVLGICTFQIPSSSSYKGLQYAIDNTTHTSNEVIANQSDCHKDVNLHEYIAFSSLRAGCRLQWLNIARELPARSLSFRQEEVFCLLMQAAWQIGPFSSQDEWEWHTELTHAQFGRVLLRQLDELMRNIEANWLESASMRSIIALTSRLLVSAKDHSTIDQAYLILRRARKVTLRWMRELITKLQDNEDESKIGEFQLCLCEVAATCRGTYDIDPSDVERLLVSAQDVATMLECAIIIHDNTPPNLSALPPNFKILLERDSRLSHALETTLCRMIRQSREGIDMAIASIWPAYRPGIGWRHLSSPNDRWLCSETASGTGKESQRIHLNILNGQLLIDGKPLSRLPQEIVKHSTYARIFGQKVFHVIPSDVQGFEYASRTLCSGYEVFFSLPAGKETLAILTRRGDELLELIPHEKFFGDLPTLLVEEYAHWLDLSTAHIELRPLQDLWTSSPNNWMIRFSTRAHSSMTKESEVLVDIRSATFMMISSHLSPLEHARYLTVTYSESSSTLSVELPRFRLSFFINNEKQLESVNLPGMEVDENQSSGTMFGLVNQIILRPKRSTFLGHTSSRCVIIPFGQLSFKQEGHHTLITIDTTSQHRRHVLYHKYRIDTELGRLVGNVSLIGKLYKVYLHAVSSHCLPDPLTGLTGTEEALIELCSASCRSFQCLEPEEIEILQQIASLTPLRTFYPPHKEVMQTVGWSQLSPIAQHNGYRMVAEQIMDYANRLQGDSHSSKPFSDTQIYLLERAARRNAIHYPEELRRLFPSNTVDVEYASRDLNLAGENSICSLSALVHTWSRNPHTPCQLFDIVKKWEDISGPQVQSPVTLSYSRDWLDLDLPHVWMLLYDLCRMSDASENRWQLVFSLCAFRYSKPSKSHLARILLAFATIPRFHVLHPPSWVSYHLSDGFQPEEDKLSRFCHSSAIPYESSPAVQLPSRVGESLTQLGQRRYSHYQTQLNLEVSRAIDLWMRQWPCETPTQLSATLFPLLCISTLMQDVRGYFQSCYHNKSLRDHLEQVQEVLDQNCLRDSQPEAPSYAFTPCSDRSPTIPSFVSLEYLFKRGAPQLKQPPAMLGINSCNNANSQTLVKSPDAQPFNTVYSDLQSLLHEFQSNSANAFHRRYGDGLAASQQALCAQTLDFFADCIPIPFDDLVEHETQCRAYLGFLLTSINQSLTPSDQIESVMSTAGLWPRLTIRSLLSKLTYSASTNLSIPWKTGLMFLAQGILSVQCAGRLLMFASLNSYDDFWKELQNNGVDAMQNPDWLLIQVDNDFHARPIQIRCANEMVAPSSQKNSVFQLNMGEGKSSVIVPLVASVLADGQKLVRVVVLKALANQMFRLLVERLSGLTNRRIFYLPFSRALQVGTERAQLIQSLYQECIQVGGILVVQPEHILSFKLMGIDRLLAAKDQEALQLLETQRWLESRSRDILDESDEILHVRYQLVYTVGQQQSPEHHPDRWTIIQQVLSLAWRHAPDIKSRFPLEVEIGKSCNGSFPRIRILQVGAATALVSQIVKDVLGGFLPNFSVGLLPENIHRIASDFISNVNISPEDAAHIEEHLSDNSSWKTLLLLRGLLGGGILSYVLKERRWRVDYGLDFTRTCLAVPYRAKDVPALRAEFGHPDVAIALTCLSYYYQGLSGDQVGLCFRHLLKLDNPTMEYENWVRANPCVPPELREISAINIKNPKQREESLIPLFHRNQAVVDFFLAQIVFPKEAKEFPEKMATSGWDIAEHKAHPTTGFSGTNDNRYLLPTSIAQCDPLGQTSTNAKVLAYLLQEENDHYLCYQKLGDPHPSVSNLLEIIVQQTPQIQVLLDVGAQVLEMRNDELAKNWLKLRSDALAALFFDDNDNLVVMTRDGGIEAFISSPLNQQLDKCLIYLDDVHTRGTDLELPQRSRAALMLGPKVTKDRLLQGAMRMRKLGHGQSVLFIAPQEVDRKIREMAGKTSFDVVRSLDILRWTMQETCADIQHHGPQWAQQGVDYLRRKKAWSRLSINSMNASVLKNSWLQPESRSLEYMYGVRQRNGLIFIEPQPPEIQLRCQELGISSLTETRMDEEQEREVVHEIERERQVERPPKAKPAKHQVHDCVRTFIRTGRVRRSSGDFFPIHIAATEPSAWSSDLLVTHDFRTTIQEASSATGEYIRPVHWIISSSLNSQTVLVVVSPYEVNELLPQIRGSKFVHLHQYTPKVMQAMKSFDHLTFYCIPPLPTTWIAPPLNLTQQLNLYAGQLYLPDYSTYQQLCIFLGIYNNQVQAEGVEIQSDGFVKPKHRRGAMANLQVCQFQRSPLPDLKELIGYRRKGMGYTLTHMGKILHARMLTEEDFD